MSKCSCSSKLCKYLSTIQEKVGDKNYLGLKMKLHYFYLLLLFSWLPLGVTSQTVSVNVNYNQVYPSSLSPGKSIRIQKIEYDGRETLYVGATNEILQLNVSNFQKLSSFKTGPMLDNPECRAQDDLCRQKSQVMTDNYNLLLLLDTYNRQVIACGNVKEGSCFLLSSSNVSDLIKTSDPKKVEHIVRSSKDSNCEALAYPDGKGSNVFVSACDSPKLEIKPKPTDIDFLICVKKLAPPKQAMSLHHFDILNQRWSYFKPINMANKNIIVVSTFTVGHFVYIVETGQFQLDSSQGRQTTRISRYSRLDSELLFTYSEIPLTCKDSSNSEYPLATAITLVKDPTPGLRSHLGASSSRSQVIMGVFRKVRSGGSIIGGAVAPEGSIVCGFSIDEIDEMFKKVIKNCFKGIGKQGLGGGLLHDCSEYVEDGLTDEIMLVEPYKDATKTKLIMLSSYPEHVMGLAPDDLVSGTEIMAYKDQQLTGIAVMTVDNEYTNILLTTTRGDLKKVSFRGESRAPNEYFEETVFQGQDTAINSDIIFSSLNNFVIFFVNSRLIKLPIHNCSAHKTCDSCVSSGGPFCGWCTLQDQCTDRSTCHTLAAGGFSNAASGVAASSGAGSSRQDDTNAWIRYEEKCIAIQEVTPEMVSIHYTEPIRLTVTRLPQPDGLDKDWLPIYYCDFGGDDNERNRAGSRAGLTRFLLDEGSTERGSCGVPTASNFLNNVPAGQAFISVTLSIVTEIEGGKRRLNLTSRLVKFYDCAALSTCIECTSSRFECDWCLASGQCVNSQLAGAGSGSVDSSNAATDITQSCHAINQRIIGEHSSTSLEPTTVRKGKDFCPQVGYPTPEHSVKFFHVGAVQTSFELAFRNIPQVRVGTENNLRCVVQQLTSGSSASSSAVKPFVQKIPALLIDGFHDRVQCVAKNGLIIPGARSNANASVTLQWGPSALLADNPEKFTIELYNCSKLAGTCGECLSYVDKKYDCGYCQSSPNGFCTISSQCENTFMTNNPENICLNPKILFFSPQSGPPTGHTVINITGENLGRSSENIIKIYVQTENGNIPCLHWSEHYHPAKNVVCQTSASTIDTEGAIVVEMNVRGSKHYLVKSGFKYRYRSSKVSDFNPKRGPLDGGTQLILNGTNLDAGSSITVHVGGYPCDIKERWAKWLMCITGAAKRPGERDYIRIEVDGVYNQQSSGMYEYTANPTVVKLEPNATIQSGGIQVNVTGSNLDVVMFPKIKLMTSTASGVSYNVSGSCTSISPTLMTCVTPKISETYLYNTAGTVSGSGNEKSNFLQRRNAVDDFLFKARIGFIMDGVVGVRLLPPDKSITVYADPYLHLETEEFSGILTLESNYPIREFVRTQSKVYVGDLVCDQLPLEKDTRIRCEIDSKVKGKSALVMVHVGKNYEMIVGKTAERHQGGKIDLIFLKLTPEEVFMAGGALIAGALVVVLVLVLCLVCVLKQYRSKDAKNKRLLEKIRRAITDNPESVVSPRANDRRGPVPVNPFTEYVNRLLFCDNVDLSQQVFCENSSSQYEIAETPMTRRRAQAQGAMHDPIPSHLKDVERWLKHDQFLLTLVDTLEADPHCTAPKKSEFLSLVMVALKSDMTYVTGVMESMVRTMVDDAYNLKFEPKSLFQRNERMAEKMVYNWLVIAMYNSVTHEDISSALNELFLTIKHLIESGAVDQVTGRSQYTINMDNVLQVSLSQDKITLHYDLGNGKHKGQLVNVPVHDSVAQLKNRIIDHCFYYLPHSQRPKESQFVLFNATEGTVYAEEHQSAQKNFSNQVWKLLTLRNLNLRDGQVVTLRPRNTQESTVDSDYPRYHGVPAMGEAGNGMGTGTMFRAPATPLLRIKDAWSTLKFSKGGAFYDNLYSNGTAAQPDYYHLEEPDNSRLVGEIREDGFLKNERRQQRKYSHRKRKTASTNNHVALNELMKNITTQRVFHTWKQAEDSIVNLLNAILYDTMRVIPYPIKYLFDFFDSVSNGRNPSHLSLWKINCLVSGFWPNLITRPDYVLDVRRSTAVEQSLTVVGHLLIEAAKFDRRQQQIPDRNRLTFLNLIETTNAIIEDFLQRTKDDKVPAWFAFRKTFLDELSQLPNDNYNDSQSRVRPFTTSNDSNSPHSQSQIQNHLWISQYRVNALRLIHDQFITVYAKPLKERFDHMENCLPEIYSDFVQKTLSISGYYQDSALSMNSITDSY